MRTAVKELAATLADIRNEGDPIGHLAAWAHAIRHPDETDQPIPYQLVRSIRITEAIDDTHTTLPAATR